MKTERWDAYDREGKPLGHTLLRGKPLPEGEYHLVCEVLLRHLDGSILLLRRDLAKEGWPGYWEATAGGSALAGEGPLEAARRELREECGYEAKDLTLLNYSLGRDTHYHSFLALGDWDKGAVRLQPGETIDFRWLTPEELSQWIDQGKLVPSQLRRLDAYLRQEGIR